MPIHGINDYADLYNAILEFRFFVAFWKTNYSEERIHLVEMSSLLRSVGTPRLLR